MSFAQENLTPIGGSADGKTTWEYIVDAVPSEIANTPDYFLSAHNLLSVNDTLFIRSATFIKGVIANVSESNNSAVVLDSITEVTI